ncbi:MAG: hypothetical protein JWM28_1546 [Chitinophagaceae bacterium]|nr:hypothetical protein [Chitinophagaceae bacterium]
MRKNIFVPAVRDRVIERISKLSAGSAPKWGKLSSAQMLRHLTEACRMAVNEIDIPDQSNLLTRSIVKWLFLNNVKPPGREKGKIKTFPQVDIIASGISVSDIDHEKENYSAIINRLINSENLNPKHPLFGNMSRNDWGYLTYAHADYHLTQFDV